MSGPFRGRDQLAIRRISVLVSKLAMSTLQRSEDSADGKQNVPARDVFRRGLLAMPSKDHWQTTLEGSRADNFERLLCRSSASRSRRCCEDGRGRLSYLGHPDLVQKTCTKRIIKFVCLGLKPRLRLS
jgi:hypothetical protein